MVTFLVVVVTGGAFLAMGAQPARGQCEANELAKLLASDGAPYDYFGGTVAISGDTALIRAPEDDDNGPESGSVYVFQYDGSSWTELTKLLAGDGQAGDDFGTWVDICGDAAVIGAHVNDDNGADSGSAYVFRYDGSNWVQEAKLLPGDGATDDRFGHRVAISGNAVLIGASWDDDNGSDSGSAYVFRYNGSSWVEEAKLLPDDGAAGDLFGTVAISGDTALIGAGWDNNDNGSDSGSAYVFRYNGSSWVQEAKLLPGDGAAYDEFGVSVALSGNAAVIGAYGDDDNGSRSGSAYVFRYNGSTWVEEAKLLASDGVEHDNFGHSVAISADIAVTGALYCDDNGNNSGAAYVFRYDGSSWTEQAKLLASDGATGDRFAHNVGIDGDIAVVGADLDDDNGSSSGSAYVFHGLSDCNDNDVLDICDIANATSADENGNGILDECENEPPVISCPPGPFTITPGSDLTFTVSATDPDLGDTITLDSSALPGGATMSPSLPAAGSSPLSSSFSWTATAPQQGLYDIVFTITDWANEYDECTVSIEVVNQPPVISCPPGPFTITAGAELTFTVSGTDPDLGDTITLDSSALPAGATMNPSLPAAGSSPLSSTFSWTPSPSQRGFHNVVFTVTDLANEYDECTVSVEVVNRPPVVTCNGPVVLWWPDHELVDVSSAFDVFDPDGDPLTLSFRVFSDEPEVPETGDGTGRHAPDFKDEHDGGRGLLVRSERRGAEDGRYYIFVITADDGNGGVTTEVCVAAVCPHDHDQQSLDDVMAQAEAARIIVQDAVDSDEVLPPSGLYEHGLSEPLGPKQ